MGDNFEKFILTLIVIDFMFSVNICMILSKNKIRYINEETKLRVILNLLKAEKIIIILQKKLA